MASKHNGTLIGRTFGVLTVIALDGVLPNKMTVWRAKCRCGKEIRARRSALIFGRQISCGCVSRRDLEPSRPSDADARDVPAHVPRYKRPEYHVWLSMKARCSEKWANPRYYGRGIRVCSRWQDDFDAFFKDMGPRPSSRHCIDRIDNDGHYEPKNCRWATYTENNNNRSVGGQIKHQVFGEFYTTGQLAHKFGLDAGIIMNRLRLGWTIERACMEPVDRRRDDRIRHNEIESVRQSEIGRGGVRLGLIK